MGVTIEYKGDTIASLSASGSKTLLTAGKYCEDNIDITYQENTSPSSPVTSKCFSVTFTEQKTGEVSFNPNGDSDIAAHYTDSSFVVGVMRLNEIDVSGFLCGIGSNNNLRTGQTAYGSWARSTGAGVSWGNMNKAVSTASNRNAANITVSSTGVISIYGSSSIPLPAGTYMVVCSW